MELYYWIVFTVFGVIIGSFLNVCIYRIPRKESIVFGSSHCTNCNENIPPYDLIPIFSYLFLGGKCRFCKQKISLRYPAVEMLNGGIYFLLYFKFGFSLDTLLYAAMSSVLIVAAMIDFDTTEVPDGLVISLLVVGVLSFFSGSISPIQRIIGFFTASGFLLVLALAIKNSVGGGDIKLMAAAGLIMGWKLILLSLFSGYIFGGIICMILIILKRIGRKQVIPFVPFLSVGIFFSAIVGKDILSWYFSFF